MSLRIDGSPDGLVITAVEVNPTTAVQIVAARPSRRKLYLQFSGDVRVGTDDTVTQSTGVVGGFLPVSPAFLETAAAVWGIAGPNNNGPGGTTTVVVIETYDKEA